MSYTETKNTVLRFSTTMFIFLYFYLYRKHRWYNQISQDSIWRKYDTPRLLVSKKSITFRVITSVISLRKMGEPVAPADGKLCY